MATYKIGTRGSLLAVTQATLVKNQLEALSGETFELVLIKTQGDAVTDKPLWQLDGKDFFTKELDEALLGEQVDFVIHSYKDLGSVRPEGIELAAITERRFAHDILLMPQDKIKVLKSRRDPLKVGTSSPRRIANLTHSLSAYLPFSKRYPVQCEMLRGNVNSRIKKLKEGQFDAITLALAGIERLAHGKESAVELAELLQGLNYIILPQSIFPSAASQGALGIEMKAGRDDNKKLYAILNKLNHGNTIDEVKREREAFKNYGGGCHLAVGIHVKKVGEDFLHVHAGEIDGKRIEKKWLEGSALPKLNPGKTLFVGLPKGERPGVVYDQLIAKIITKKKVELTQKHVFVTSKYCLDTLKASTAPEGIWAAGVKTAQLLTSEGFWVNGTSDSLGTRDLQELKQSKALKLLHAFIDSKWTVLSHNFATSDLGKVEGCYTRQERALTPEFDALMKKVGACLWTSYHQYETYMKRFPHLKYVIHCSGLGKTWEELKKHGVKTHVVPSMQEFYELK